MSVRFRKMAALFVLVGACLFTSVGVASAQVSPAATAPTATVDNTNPAPGEDVTVSGSGFQPNSDATIVLGAEVLRTVRTDAAGAFTTTVTIPCVPPGPQNLEVRGTDPAGASRVLTTTLQVADEECLLAEGGAQARGALARTGSSSTTPLTAAGVGLVLMGATAVVVARRRRAAQAIR